MSRPAYFLLKKSHQKIYDVWIILNKILKINVQKKDWKYNRIILQFSILYLIRMNILAEIAT